MKSKQNTKAIFNKKQNSLSSYWSKCNIEQKWKIDLPKQNWKGSSIIRFYNWKQMSKICQKSKARI